MLRSSSWVFASAPTMFRSEIRPLQGGNPDQREAVASSRKQLRILLVTFRQILSKATTSCKLLPSSCIDADLLLAPPAKVPAAPEDAPVRLEAAKTNSGPAGDLWTRWKSSCRTSSTVLQVLSGIFNKSYGLQECLILLWHRVSADLGGGLV